MSERQQSLHTRLLEAETSANVQLVRVQPNQLLSRTHVRFNLTESIDVRLERQSMQRRGTDSYTWIGQTDLFNNAVLVVRNGQVTGSVRCDGQLYSIKPLTGDLHALVTVDEARLPGDHPSMFDDHPHEDIEAPHRGASNGSPDTPSPSSALGSSLPADIPSASVEPTSTSQTLDVIVAYTPQADAAVADMQAHIQLAVDETNLSYSNSGTETRIALVHLYATSTNSTDDMDVELEQFRTPGDGAFDEIHDLRETYGADIAKLIGAASSNYGFCGLASVIEARTAAGAFAMTAHDCATGNYTFAHEIGHLQGARHNPNSDQNLFPYAFGHGTTDINNDFRTVMGLNDTDCADRFCGRVPYWSTPDPDGAYGETVTGDAALRDNVSVLDLTTPRIASFKGTAPTAQPRFTASVQSVERTIAPGGTATETITITNPGEQELYWRASTSGNVKRSGDPDGPVYDWTDISESATATRVGIDGEVDLPFSFPFYGETYSTATIGFNGVLYFEDAPSSIYDTDFYQPQFLPNRFGQSGFLAAFWSSSFPPVVDFPQTGEIYTDVDEEGHMVVQWHQIENFFTGQQYTFQAILSPDGDILFQYHTIEDPDANASVGVESPSGCQGVNAGYRTGVLSDSYIKALPVNGSAIAIGNYDVVRASSYEGRIPPGESMEVPLRFDAIGKAVGTYTRNLTFTTNEADNEAEGASHTIPVDVNIAPTPNQALTLGGTEDFVRADGVSDALAGSALTLEAWVLPTGGTGQQGLTTFHTATGNNRNLLFYREGRFQYYDDGTGYVPSRNEFPAGQWVHVAVTIGASGQGTLYVNGREEATFTTSVRPEANGLFSIGQEWDAGPSATDFFEGRLDEVRIWNAARTQAQIQQGMTTSLGTDNTLGGAFDLTDLVAHYRFEGNALEETGTYPATVQGAPTYESDVEQAPAEDALIVRVNAATSGGAGNGTSWANAHADLQDGLAGTGPENQVWIAAGTYTPGTNRGDSFTITGAQDGLQVYGGFAGGESALADRDPSANETVLSGDIGTEGDTSDNAYHVLVFDGGDRLGANVDPNITPATVLSGVTVTGGNANGSFPDNLGGGLLCDGQGSGNECSPQLTGLTFAGNTASVAGGAIYNDGRGGTSSPVVTNAIFTGNSAGSGGAIFNDGIGGVSSPAVTNATFTGNSARFDGGAIYFFGDGGSIAALVTNSLFANNGASHIAFDDGEAGEQPRFVNCTFTGATDFAFDVQFYDSGETPLTVVNSVLWDNGPGGIVGTSRSVTAPDEAVDVTFSMVEEAGYAAGSGDANAGAGNINQDPLFADASGPAGPDGVFGTDDDGLRLTNDSPAIARGTFAPFESGGIAESVTTDLGGEARRFGLFPDLGAYELSTVVSTSDQITGATGLVGYVEPTGFGGRLLLRSPADGAPTYSGDLTFTRTEARPSSSELPDNVAPVTWTVTSTLTPAPTYDLALDVSSLSGIGDFDALVLYKSDDGGQTWDPVADLGGAPVLDEGRALVAVQDLTGFSQFAIGSTEASNPLPVELAGLEARRSGTDAVTVQWQTLSETNNAGFEVQRASAPNMWQTIARLNGAGTTDQPQSYRFADRQLPYAADSLSYRLRQIDTGGTESFSEAVTIARPVAEAELLPTYPNPARGMATVRFAVPERQDVRIVLYDLMGRRVQTVVDKSAEGRTEQVLDVSGLASGTYFLRMQVEGYTETQRITVVR